MITKKKPNMMYLDNKKKYASPIVNNSKAKISLYQIWTFEVTLFGHIVVCRNEYQLSLLIQNE